MSKKVLDTQTGVTLEIRLHDRQTDATVIMIYKGDWYEAKAAGQARLAAIKAYADLDYETFGEIYARNCDVKEAA